MRLFLIISLILIISSCKSSYIDETFDISGFTFFKVKSKIHNSDYFMMRNEVTNLQMITFLNSYIEKNEFRFEKINNNLAVVGYYAGDAENNIGENPYYKKGEKLYFYLEGNAKIPFINWNSEKQLFEIVDEKYNFYPVTRVSWFLAHAFAKFYSFNIPTEKQWLESAKYYMEINNFSKKEISNLSNQKTGEIKPINKYDFFGNISEWTSSIYTLPSSPFRTIMGTSCFDLQDKYLSIQYRKSNFAPQVLRDVGLRFMSQIRIK